jgi:thymidylate synthase (FAD)
MKVKLINYSQDPEGRNLLEQIAYCARVSNPSNQDNTDTAEKLVRYLIKNQHWSPLEMVSVCLEIDTTRDIARQILRHRSFSFQEFSQRYADASQLGFETREARLQDNKNRQNSIKNDNQALEAWWENYQLIVQRTALDAYQFALDKGIAKEQARSVLPEGMTKSRMYMNGTLRSWVHYIQLRSANGTQKEHQEIALACADAIEPIFPMIKEYVNE